MTKIDEGEPCPENCGGHLHYPKVENCSCRLWPPCPACMDNRLTCDSCGWTEEDEK